jgi:hypothetical protein
VIECFELNGNLTVEDVPDVRRFVERLHRRISSDDDVGRVAMATHELLENAVKFSADGETSLRVELDPSQVAITTRNRAKPEHLDELQQIARELSESIDPMLFYLELMRRTRARPGGLGLGRVAAEGGMTIELALDGEIVQIRAQATLGVMP